MKDFKHIYHKFQTDTSEPEHAIKTTEEHMIKEFDMPERKYYHPQVGGLFQKLILALSGRLAGPGGGEAGESLFNASRRDS